MSDLERDLDWFDDVNVMGKTFSKSEIGKESISQRITRYIEHQERHGLSKWVVIHKKTGQLIGDAGIVVIESLDSVYDLGFRLKTSWWGKGYGYEITECWKESFVSRSISSELYAHVDKHNRRSRRLLEKSKFHFVRGLILYGKRVEQYVWKCDLANIK